VEPIDAEFSFRKRCVGSGPTHIASGPAQRLRRSTTLTLTMTRGTRCHGCTKFGALGNCSASLLSVNRLHPKLASIFSGSTRYELRLVLQLELVPCLPK
jgi:hypothetical protein